MAKSPNHSATPATFSRPTATTQALAPFAVVRAAEWCREARQLAAAQLEQLTVRRGIEDRDAPDLETALREEVEGRVELRFSCSISAIENSSTGVTATLTDGSHVDAAQAEYQRRE
jgi:2-polyprenyl-6-methoxyphenol hydroxylase-like FAD-dependent oxidoreductase